MRRSTVFSFAALVVGMALVVAATSCGGKSSALIRAERGLAACFQATNTTRDAFVAWNKSEQDRIVEEAPSLEAGKTALAIYREKRMLILRGFARAYTAIGLASSALLLYDAGRVGEAVVIQRLGAAAKAVEDVLRAWEILQ